MSALTGRVATVMRSGAGIAIAMAVMNVATYGFTMIAANQLGPRQYGAMAAMMNLLLVATVGSLGLQATAARRIAADPQHVGQIETEVLRVTQRLAVGLGVALLVFSPVVNKVLKLDSLPLAALAAVAVVPLTLMGGYAGILQGERRWLPLGLLYMAAGLPRLLIGTAMLLWRPTETVAIVAVTIAAVAPVVVGWWTLRADREPGTSSETHEGRAIVRETLHNSQALLAFFALSNADIVVARNALSDHDAGLYAGGLILAKAMIFLPQFVVIVAFPAMASVGRRTQALTRSLALVGTLGMLGTLASWLLSSVALVFVGGRDYSEIQGDLWLFAILGTVLAMLQLLVYSVLARQGQRSVYFVWLALIALVGGGVFMDTRTALLTWVLAVDTALLVVLVVIAYYLVRREPAPQPQDDEVSNV